MCCGNRVSTSQSATTVTWAVVDASGSVVDTKTSEIAAKLSAARIGGGATVERRTSQTA